MHAHTHIQRTNTHTKACTHAYTHTHLQWWEPVVSEKLAFPLHLTPKSDVQPQQRGLQWSEAHRGKDIMEIATLVLQCEGAS